MESETDLGTSATIHQLSWLGNCLWCNHYKILGGIKEVRWKLHGKPKLDNCWGELIKTSYLTRTNGDFARMVKQQSKGRLRWDAIQISSVIISKQATLNTKGMFGNLWMEPSSESVNIRCICVWLNQKPWKSGFGAFAFGSTYERIKNLGTAFEWTCTWEGRLAMLKSGNFNFLCLEIEFMEKLWGTWLVQLALPTKIKMRFIFGNSISAICNFMPHLTIQKIPSIQSDS